MNLVYIEILGLALLALIGVAIAISGYINQPKVLPYKPMATYNKKSK